MSTPRQFTRFAIVGLLGNFTLYLLYLTATWAGLGPKVAMTSLYALGVLLTFVFNKNWSFGDRGPVPGTLFRYVFVYLLGYVINLTALYLLVDRAGLPHQGVQGLMILLIAVGLFLCQKFWIFNAEARS